MENKIKRGVSVYSYAGEWGWSMTLEDCFKDIYDMGATGIEILADTHIEGYPKLTDEFLAKWNGLCEKYQVEPVEYGHWIDTRLYQSRDISVEEARAKLINDFQIANKMGFHILRTKMGVIDDKLTPMENWREIIESVLDEAEKYDVIMCPEIHLPSNLKDQFVQDFVDFIDETGTKNFGLNVDMGVFRNHFDENTNKIYTENPHSEPEDIIPLLPYVKVVHAKFNNLDDDFNETTIPYPEVLKIMIEHDWEGYFLSEYEGEGRDIPGLTSHLLRKHHVMMKRILGH